MRILDLEELFLDSFFARVDEGEEILVPLEGVPMVDEKNRPRFENFLEGLHRLEQQHAVHIGEVFHNEDSPDEIELWDGPCSDQFSIDQYYGHYAVFKRPPDAGAELEQLDQVDGSPDTEENLYSRCMRQVKEPTPAEMFIHRVVYELGQKEVEQLDQVDGDPDAGAGEEKP